MGEGIKARTTRTNLTSRQIGSSSFFSIRSILFLRGRASHYMNARNIIDTNCHELSDYLHNPVSLNNKNNENSWKCCWLYEPIPRHSLKFCLCGGITVLDRMSQNSLRLAALPSKNKKNAIQTKQTVLIIDTNYQNLSINYK